MILDSYKLHTDESGGENRLAALFLVNKKSLYVKDSL